MTDATPPSCFPEVKRVASLGHNERQLADKSPTEIKATSKQGAKEHSVQKEDWIEYKPKCTLVKSFDGERLRQNNKSLWSVQLTQSLLLGAAKLPLLLHCTRPYISVNSTLFLLDVHSHKCNSQNKNVKRSEYIDVCTVIPKWIWHCWNLSVAMMHVTQEVCALGTKKKEKVHRPPPLSLSVFYQIKSQFSLKCTLLQFAVLYMFHFIIFVFQLYGSKNWLQ